MTSVNNNNSTNNIQSGNLPTIIAVQQGLNVNNSAVAPTPVKPILSNNNNKMDNTVNKSQTKTVCLYFIFLYLTV